jgi:hypothetical protein
MKIKGLRRCGVTPFRFRDGYADQESAGHFIGVPPPSMTVLTAEGHPIRGAAWTAMTLSGGL